MTYLGEQRLRGLYLAPHLGVRHEQQLLGAELLEARQSGLTALALHGAQVGAVSLADAAVVCNVLTLCVLAV